MKHLSLEGIPDQILKIKIQINQFLPMERFG